MVGDTTPGDFGGPDGLSRAAWTRGKVRVPDEMNWRKVESWEGERGWMGW